jgi:pimeloyl-ACP methyl ester carboxylesterase
MTDAVFKSPSAGDAIADQYRQVLDAWPIPHTEQSLPTRSGSTFVVSCGPEAAPPVVLLHGAQANSAAWLPDIPLWAQRFRLHAVDVIGEAGFSAAVRPPLAGDAYAAWLDDVLAGLGLDHAALAGTSFGGWIALDYAVRRLGKVDALALICPAGIGRQKNFVLKALPLLLLGPWGQHKMREMVFGPAPAELPEDVRPMGALMNAIAKSVRPRVVAIPQLGDAQLASLTMPILAIVGGRDALLDSYDTRDRLSRNAPHAEIEFLEAGYHYLPNQAPRIMAFLARSLHLR